VFGWSSFEKEMVMKNLAFLTAAALAAASGLSSSAFAQCASLTIGSTPNAVEVGTDDTFVNGDDVIGTIFFPFNVSLYGVEYNAATVSSNGNLQFGSGSNSWTNTCPLPSATFLGGPSVMPFWDDLRTDTAGSGIFTSVSGTPGSQRFNVEWRATTFASAAPVNFVVSFYEGQSYFDVFYVSMSDNGASASVGVQADGSAGSSATAFSCNQPNVTSGTSVRYSCPDVLNPTVSLSLDTSSGAVGTVFVASAPVTLGQGGSPITSVILDASNVDGGSVALLDNGVAPDITANDGTYTGSVTVGAAAALGAQSMTVTATDAASRSDTATASFTVTLPPTPGTNGPFQTGTGDGFNGGNTSAIETGFNTFGYTASTASFFAVADDFVVTDAAGWSLNSVTVYAYQTQTTPNPVSTFNDIRISIFAVNPNGTQAAPTYGDFTTNRLLSTAFTGVYRVTPTTLTNGQRAIMSITADLSDIPDLAPGTYWIGWTLGGTQASGPFTVPVVPTPVGANAQQRNFGLAAPTNWDTLNLAAGTPAQELAFDLDFDVVQSCDYDFNQDENVDLLDAQQMAQVFVGLLTPEANWLDGDLNGDENADLTDAQILAAFVVSGNCNL
jgi:hypothetical protein